MRKFYCEFWGGMVEAKEVSLSQVPDEARYVCSDLDEGYDLYEGEEGECYIVLC